MKVKELIAILEKLEPDNTVVISDADTRWELNIQDVEEWSNDIVTISGDYDNIYTK